MQHNEKGLLVVFSGPAGSGKGTVRKIIESKQHFEFSVSATTRALRPGEVDGVDYIVYTHDEFRKAIADNNMLEYTEYCSNFYGTPKAPVLECLDAGKDMLLEIEVDGASQVKRAFPEAVLVMLLPPTHEKQRERLEKRNTEPPEVIEERLEITRKELEFIDIYDYVIYNYDGGEEAAADDFLAIIRAEKCANRRRIAVKDSYFGK